MKATQPLIFSALILAASTLSQTDAFARFEHHDGHGDWTEGGRPEVTVL